MSNPRKRKYPVTRGRIAAGLICFVLAFCVWLDAYLNQPDESPYQQVTMVYCEDSDNRQEYIITDNTQVDLIEAVVDAAVDNGKSTTQPMSFPRIEVYYTTQEGSEGIFRIDDHGIMTFPNSGGNYTVGKWQSDTFEQLLTYLPEGN